MIIYVDANAKHDGNGTKELPFRRINEAAKIAMPGDEVIGSLRAALTDTAGDTPLSFPSSGPEIRIDYIFTSGHFKKADMQTFATQASDHLPAYIDTSLV